MYIINQTLSQPVWEQLKIAEASVKKLDFKFNFQTVSSSLFSKMTVSPDSESDR